MKWNKTTTRKEEGELDTFYSYNQAALWELRSTSQRKMINHKEENIIDLFGSKNEQVFSMFGNMENWKLH